tara:strand:- start:30 stop:260 length:231 start_codon:yes stop_codon:yes gene_type:complete
MGNTEFMNLVTTELIQKKKIIQYNLRKEVNESCDDVDKTINLLSDYNKIIGDIHLWQSLIDEANTPQKNEGENNNK